MSDFTALLEELTVSGALSIGPGAEPFGRAWLASERLGVDLDALGYVEDEFLIAGTAQGFAWNDARQRVASAPGPFTTRILVRRPRDPRRFSGTVQLEPHHPEADHAPSWAALAPWIIRAGHAHVGVTQDPRAAADLTAWDPDRYGALSIPDPSHRWDILGLTAAAIRSGAIPSLADLTVARVVMSGWSMTGTICRTFLGERFHERAVHAGAPALSAYVVCISSGNAGRAGYLALSEDRELDCGDPRRTIQPHAVPVIELLSEMESETHRPVLRPDSDGPADPYRLYQVAGTGHVMARDRTLNTNRRQLALRGRPVDGCAVREPASDGRMDLVARAVFAALDRWLTQDVAPPRATRFDFADPAGDGPRGLSPEALPLRRDGDGNVLGGIRTPWIDVPTATYLPHSTPAPEGCDPFVHLAGVGPAHRADLIAHMVPFAPTALRARYGDPQTHQARFARRAAELVQAGWLLADDLPELIDARRDGHVAF